jgi:DnaK suppressor protein
MQACPPTTTSALRETLVARLSALQQELAAAEEARQSERWLDSHEVSDLKDVAERRLWSDQISAQERRDQAEADDVRAALARLDEGHYGLCLACGEPIAEARLQVQPAAPRCAACQTAAERAGHRHSNLHP